jgi:EAL and modified HD-GYP domain-containing signal transduction protein
MSTIQESTPPEDASASESTAIARQAILDAERAVFGYELFDRSVAPDAHTATSDAELLFNVLSHAEHGAQIGNKLMFINCTLDSLAGPHLQLIHPDRVVLEIPPLPGNPPDEIETWLQTLMDVRRKGFRLAFNQMMLSRPYASWLPQASFVKIDLSQFKPELVEPMVEFARKNSSAQLIAEKVETADQYELAAKHGIKLFQGYWFAKPVLITGQTLRPAQANIIQLINLVRHNAEPEQIEVVLKRDPTLSFNLLRFINSAGFGLSCEITSFRHAVMILGLKKLFRWAALLLTTSRPGGSPPAVGTTAVVRGRLMELLTAELLPPEECDNAFVVGVFSMLDTMLGMPMAKVLESISLPESVANALLRHSGLYAPFLELAIACETTDDEAFAHAASQLQLTNQQVNMAHLQALAWAETMTI